MKKQYRDITQNNGEAIAIQLYHDGKLIAEKSCDYESWEWMEYECSLENEGYTRGYTSDDIQFVKNRLDKMIDNIINPVESVIEPRCPTCIYRMRCSHNEDYANKCSYYSYGEGYSEWLDREWFLRGEYL